MRTRLVLLLAILAIAATLIGLGRSADVAEDEPEGEQVAAPSRDNDIDEACLTDYSYRARFAEMDPETDDTFVELLQEVTDDQIRVEANNGLDLLVVGRDAWTYQDDEWQELPAMPVRPLRVPWVNNFITAEELAFHFTFVDTGDIAQGRIAARIYRPSLEEMITAFGDRFRDRDYDPAATTFEYWIDACDVAVFADVTLTFAGDDAEFAASADIPLTLRYTYEPFDVGAPIPSQLPEGVFDPIPRPSG